MSIKTRFAPSPTGFVHIGGLRTALFNYLYARKNGGKFLLRIEDTDRTRFVDGATASLINALKWAGLEIDEGADISEGKLVSKGEKGPYIQSERLDIYQKYIKILLDKGCAYPCFCSRERLDELRETQRQKGIDPMYDGHCKNMSKEEVQKRIEAGEEYVIRLNVPKNQDITFNDGVRGKVTINSDTVDDQVLIKSDGFPTYHFAVVVDDHLMGVTHVIRGEEWLTSTPKHILLYDMLGFEKPEFAHLPNILNSDHKKLSKRQGDVSVDDFKNKGYLPEGLINYIALLGWSPENNQEIFTMKELEEQFDLNRVSSSGGIFDKDKLNWINAQHIKTYDSEKLVELAMPFILSENIMNEKETVTNRAFLVLAMDALKERLEYLAQFPEMIKPFLQDEFETEEEAKDFIKKEHMPKLFSILKGEIEKRDKITENDAEEIFKLLKSEGIKGKNLFMGVRVLITGNMHGPDIPKIMQLLGRDRILKRLEMSKAYLAV